MSRPVERLPIFEPADAGDICSDCGGDRRAMAWPKGKAGCGCAARAVIRAQRAYVAEIAAKGTLSDLEYAAYLAAGSYPGPDGAR